MKNLPVYLIMGLALSSCSGSPPVPDGPGEIQSRMFQSGFSVVPPQEKGWLVMDRDAYRLILVKPGENRDETYAAIASLILLPTDLKTREMFFEHIQKARLKEIQSAGFRVLSNQESLFDESGEVCVRYRSQSEEPVVSKDFVPKGRLVNDSIGLYCRHPGEATVAVKVEYAYRHRVDHADQDLEKKADLFLSAVNFESLADY